jgi:hypothetical protein
MSANRPRSAPRAGLRLAAAAATLLVALPSRAAAAADLLDCDYQALPTPSHPQPEIELHARCAIRTGEDTIRVEAKDVRALDFGSGLAVLNVRGDGWYYLKPDGTGLAVLTLDNGPDPSPRTSSASVGTARSPSSIAPSTWFCRRATTSPGRSKAVLPWSAPVARRPPTLTTASMSRSPGASGANSTTAVARSCRCATRVTRRPRGKTRCRTPEVPDDGMSLAEGSVEGPVPAGNQRTEPQVARRGETDA